MSKTRWMIGALALLSTAALAADGKMQPGLWEYTMKMEMPGMPFVMPPQTFQRCMTEQDVDKGDYARNPREKSDCEIKNMKHSAGRVSYDVACKGERPMTGHYEFTMTPTSMTGAGNMDMEGQTMKQNMSAKRVGDCKK